MSSNRRRELDSSNQSKLRMDRKPNATRITDPSHPAGKRKEIDNVMKKARQSNAGPNDYWDKKLLEVEEKDPNRWRHSGYKKMYIGNGRESSSDNDREKFRNTRKSRSHSPQFRGRRTPQSPIMRRRLSKSPKPRSPERRHRSPINRYQTSTSRRSPLPTAAALKEHRPIKPVGSKEIYRQKRPISPPIVSKGRSPSVSSCSDDSCSVYSEEIRSRPAYGSASNSKGNNQRSGERNQHHHHGMVSTSRIQPSSPDHDKIKRITKTKASLKEMSPKRRHLKHQTRLISPPKSSRHHHSIDTQEAPAIKKLKEKPVEKVRTRIKIEGEKRRHRSPSTSDDDSDSSENSFPTLTATTKLSLSERFGKMAQWNNDRKYDSNMENMNMKITKNSSGGELKVLIQEGVESPQQRARYSPAPEGHFPEELLAQAPSGMMGGPWDDVRVRYEYYKSRGYLRDLSLKDYIQWENWWYRYQEWLKQERYYEMMEQMNRRRRKKMPIAQRLN